MTKEQLDAIRARLGVATPGPWTPSSHCCSMGLYPVGPSHEFSERYDGPRLRADVFFIANAPTDLRALLDEVERLTDERDAAFRRGAEAMRTALLQRVSWGSDLADRIRDEPVPEDK